MVFGLIKAYFILKAANIFEHVLLVRHQFACRDIRLAAIERAKMKGCGLVVINPPWQFDREAEAVLGFLAAALAQAPGGAVTVRWLVPE